MYSLEAPIDATVNDILNFLEEENQFIPPYTHLSELSNGKDVTVNFHCKRVGNTFSVYTKIYTTKAGTLGPKTFLDDPNGQGNEVIRFGVRRLTDGRSLVKGSYDADNLVIELMFWRRWTKLAISFGAEFARDAQINLQELEKTEQKWGWVESPTTLLGNKVRHWAPLPKETKEETSISNPEAKQDNDVSINISGDNNGIIIVGNENKADNKFSFKRTKRK